MMNSMYTAGAGSGLVFFWALHFLSMLVLGIGVLFLLFWAFKNLSAQSLWTWGWILVGVGIVLCLLTVPAWPAFGVARGPGMMGRWQGAPQGAASADQQKEEAEGKALYDKLQAKQTTCTDLSDNDFELIGEYFMGQQAAAGHEQVNAMIKQMMGDDGEVQMHILIGKNAAGCVAGSKALLPSGGMMQGGGMMRGFNASSVR